MFSNQAEKMELLKELIFGNERRLSEAYLQKLSKNIKTSEKDFDKNSGALEFANKEIEKIKSEKNELCEKYVVAKKKSSQKKIANLEKLNQIRTILRDRIEEAHFQNRINQGIEEKKEKFKNYEEKLSKYPDSLNINFIRDWTEVIELNKKYKELDIEEEIVFSSEYEFEPDNLDQLLEMIPISKKSQEIKEKYGEIEDVLNYLDDLINKHQKYLGNHHKKEKFLKLEKAKKYQLALQKLEPSIEQKWQDLLIICEMQHDDLFFRNVEELEKVKKIIFDECDTYSCPSCEANLIMEGNQLKLGKAEISDESKECFGKIENFIRKEKLILGTIEECKDASNYEEYEEINQYEVETEIEELHEYEPEIPDPITINKLISRYKKQEKKEEILNRKISLSSGRFDDLEYPKDINKYYEVYCAIHNEFKSCAQFLKDNEHREVENNLDEDNVMLKEIDKKIMEIEDMVETIEEYKMIEDKEKEIVKLEKKRKELIVQSETSKKMEKIVKETESEVMNNNIDTINLQLNNILTTLFEDIRIELNMIKNLKSGEAKPSVNLKIMIDGKDYNNIDYLSGGEQDRISLALTIVFNLILGSEIIMLDEVMSSLDAVTREKCLRIMKRYLKNKIILNICHETIEGYYDQIIEI